MDDADLFVAFGVGDQYDHPSQQADRDEALVTVGEPLILVGQCIAIEGLGDIDGVDPVLRQVRAAFRLVLTESAGILVTHCSVRGLPGARTIGVDSST